MRRDDLTIETPCAKDWNAMRPADAKKRFCDECKMHVHAAIALPLTLTACMGAAPGRPRTPPEPPAASPDASAPLALSPDAGAPDPAR